jgi:outer membrane receptor protein involved in Fe transport
MTALGIDDLTLRRYLRRRLGFLVAALSGSLGLGLAGAEPVRLNEMLDLSLDRLAEVRITGASKVEQRAIDVAAPVMVLSKEEIRRFGWRTLGEVLESMPGLSVSDDRSYQYLGVRGFNFRDFNSRVLVLLDGRRTNESMYDQSFIERTFLLDVEAIERVEFIAGPGSAMYGHNALLGVVNVITRKGSDVSGTRARGDFGGGGARGVGLQWGSSVEKGDSTQLFASTWQQRGWPLALPPYGISVRGLDAERVSKLFAQGTVQDWSWSAGVVQRDKGVPTAPYETVVGDPGAAIHDRLGQVSLSRKSALGKNASLFSQVLLGAYEFRNDYRYQAAPAVLNHDQVHGRWVNAESRLQWQPVADHAVVAGFEWQSNPRQTYVNADVDPPYRWYSQEGRTQRLGIFVADRWRLSPKLEFDVGLRSDWHRTQGALSDCSDVGVACQRGPFSAGGQVLSPRVAALYQPRSDTALKFAYGQAFRVANPTEMAYVVPGQSPQIAPTAPEQMTRWNAILEHHPAAQSKWWLDLFRQRLDGLIITAAGSGRPVNAEALYNRGWQLGFEWREPMTGWQLRGGLTRSSVSDSAGERPADSPATTARFALGMPILAGWHMGLEVMHDGPRKTLAGLQVAGQTRARVHFDAGRTWHPWQVGLTVDNLFNTALQDPARGAHAPLDVIAQPPRQAMLRVSRPF